MTGRWVQRARQTVRGGRIRTLIVILAVACLVALAVNGPRVVAAIDQTLHPKPAPIIIVAPVASEII